MNIDSSMFFYQSYHAQVRPSDASHDTASDVAVDEMIEEEIEQAEPPLYSVVMHNDDYTTMDFVVYVLVNVFGHTLDKSVELMYAVHETGRAVVAILPHQIAEMRVAQVNELAEEMEYPLLITLEKN